MDFDVKKVENIINYTFNDKSLIKSAFTHKSYSNEHKSPDNERLEFLGDSVLGMVVADYLFRKYQKDDNENILTEYKQALVSTYPLSEIIKENDLGKFLIKGKGVELIGDKADRILENLFESIVGAIYLDGGISCARKFICDFLIINEEKFIKVENINPKSSLQEYTQAKKWGIPEYRLISKTGPDHNPEFLVEVLIGNKQVAKGCGESKSKAEKQAAITALNNLRQGKFQ